MLAVNTTFSLSKRLVMQDGRLIPIQDRKAIFVSHANPEENAFASWLTLRLAREGYEVWCDVVRLFAGDDFWKDIEKAIRQQTRKFIFVVSRSSNQKQGTLQELSVASVVAKQLEDSSFIIPVKTDDLPYSDHNIQINRLIALDFTKGWAGELTKLLKALEDDKVPKSTESGPKVVASWWNAHRLNRQIIRKKPELLMTNWFPINGLPSHVWILNDSEDSRVSNNWRYPAYRIDNRLITFANPTELVEENLPPNLEVSRVKLQLDQDLPRNCELEKHKLTTAVRQLLKDAWHRMVHNMALPLFDLSSGKKTLWFPNGVVDGGTVSFIGVDGKKARRDLNGFMTRTKNTGEKYKRYWHFGLEAVPMLYPTFAIGLKSHVVFSLDGMSIQGDAKAQHKARRSQCKNWWNDKWRDLTLASVSWLAKGESSIPLIVNSADRVSFDIRPIGHVSDIGYDDNEIRTFTGPQGLESINEDEAETVEDDDFNG